MRRPRSGTGPGPNSSGGVQTGANESPDCGLLKELRATMKVLVDTQQAKWAYMFAKLDKELGK